MTAAHDPMRTFLNGLAWPPFGYRIPERCADRCTVAVPGEKIMWTFLIGLCIFVGLAAAALWLGQRARRRFPKAYVTVDKIVSNIDLLFIVAVFFAVFYMTR